MRPLTFLLSLLYLLLSLILSLSSSVASFSSILRSFSVVRDSSPFFLQGPNYLPPSSEDRGKWWQEGSAGWRWEGESPKPLRRSLSEGECGGAGLAIKEKEDKIFMEGRQRDKRLLCGISVSQIWKPNGYLKAKIEAQNNVGEATRLKWRVIKAWSETTWEANTRWGCQVAKVKWVDDCWWY